MRTDSRLGPALVLLVALWPVVAAGQAPSGPDEEVEEVQVKPVPTSGGAETARRGAADLVGRLHPLLVHFPIAWLLLLLLADVVTFGLGRRSWERAGQWLLLLTAVSFAAAIVTGLLRASGMQVEGAVAERLAQHRTAALLAGGVCLAAAVLRRFAPIRGRARVAAYLLLVVLATLAVLAAGHLGGKMVFGEDYLPF